MNEFLTLHVQPMLSWGIWSPSFRTPLLIPNQFLVFELLVVCSALRTHRPLLPMHCISVAERIGHPSSSAWWVSVSLFS
jgi:hypothetical protein